MPHLSLPITDQGHGFTRLTGFTVQEHMQMAKTSMMRCSERDAHASLKVMIKMRKLTAVNTKKAVRVARVALASLCS